MISTSPSKMNTVVQLLALGLAAQLLLLCWCQGVRAEEEEESLSLQTPGRTDSVRHKRAPGWGKRDSYDSELDGADDLVDVVDDSPVDKRAPGWGKRDFEADKRAPGWGKRDFEADKRAPGWGKRAPGWGKRAPGWGKRAPGWGKRAPGWGKRAPGWGKRNVFLSEPLGMDKRAPGWGKRAPGWGKRAPGWGKRSIEQDLEACEVLRDEADLFISKAMEAELRFQTQCGNEADASLVARK